MDSLPPKENIPTYSEVEYDIPNALKFRCRSQIDDVFNVIKNNKIVPITHNKLLPKELSDEEIVNIIKARQNKTELNKPNILYTTVKVCKLCFNVYSLMTEFFQTQTGLGGQTYESQKRLPPPLNQTRLNTAATHDDTTSLRPSEFNAGMNTSKALGESDLFKTTISSKLSKVVKGMPPRPATVNEHNTTNRLSQKDKYYLMNSLSNKNDQSLNSNRIHSSHSVKTLRQNSLKKLYDTKDTKDQTKDLTKDLTKDMTKDQTKDQTKDLTEHEVVDPFDENTYIREVLHSNLKDFKIRKINSDIKDQKYVLGLAPRLSAVSHNSNSNTTYDIGLSSRRDTYRSVKRPEFNLFELMKYKAKALDHLVGNAKEKAPKIWKEILDEFDTEDTSLYHEHPLRYILKYVPDPKEVRRMVKEKLEKHRAKRTSCKIMKMKPVNADKSFQIRPIPQHRITTSKIQMHYCTPLVADKFTSIPFLEFCATHNQKKPVSRYLKDIRFLIYDQDIGIPYLVLTSEFKEKKKNKFLIVFNDLFHSFLEHIDTLEKLIPFIDDTQILLFNYPGQAFTRYESNCPMSVDAISAVADALICHMQETNVFSQSHSMYFLSFGYGGAIAGHLMNMMADVSENLKGSLFINSFLDFDDEIRKFFEDWELAYESLPESDLQSQLIPYYSLALSQNSELLLDKTWLEMKADYNPITIEDRKYILKSMLSTPDNIILPNFSKLTVPIFVIHSLNNYIIPQKYAHLIAGTSSDHPGDRDESAAKKKKNEDDDTGYPNRKIFFFGGGHSLMDESPEEMVKIISDFIVWNDSLELPKKKGTNVLQLI